MLQSLKQLSLLCHRGLSCIFAVLASFLVWCDYFFKSGRSALASAEQFQTAGRSIKAGLIAVDVRPSLVAGSTWSASLQDAESACLAAGGLALDL